MPSGRTSRRRICGTWCWSATPSQESRTRKASHHSQCRSRLITGPGSVANTVGPRQSGARQIRVFPGGHEVRIVRHHGSSRAGGPCPSHGPEPADSEGIKRARRPPPARAACPRGRATLALNETAAHLGALTARGRGRGRRVQERGAELFASASRTSCASSSSARARSPRSPAKSCGRRSRTAPAAHASTPVERGGPGPARSAVHGEPSRRSEPAAVVFQ
jgi:hypothetical protein